IEATPLELRGALEGAFALGQGGLWVHSVASLRTTDLSPSTRTADERAFSQSFNLGFYGRTLVSGGVSWDWLRTVGPDATAIPKPATVKLGLGGVSKHAADGADFRRADWLLEASYQLPYQADEFLFWNAFNLGLDADFRLGSIALLEASISHRLHRKAVTGAATDFAAALNWAIGLGIRLPSPFAWGVEYGGDLIWPFDSAGARGALEPFRGGRFRFFFQYSI
ncbi:MAG: hypothetical protein Q8M76_10780, partial [Spirochaetaceae bacterium]|nr:hypothetical protein [Spirochaetaceae bacterium]